LSLQLINQPLPTRYTKRGNDLLKGIKDAAGRGKHNNPAASIPHKHHHRIMNRHIATALAAIAAVIALTTTPAHGHATDEPLSDGSALWLATTSQDGFQSAILTCQPPGGTHPQPWRACAEITEADGNLDELSGLPDLVCTTQYKPVTAMAYGTWQGQPVTYTHTFGNACELKRSTYPVFALTGGTA
jgi:hypothetical protein